MWNTENVDDVTWWKYLQVSRQKKELVDSWFNAATGEGQSQVGAE